MNEEKSLRNIAARFVDEDRAIRERRERQRKTKIAAMPRIRFVCRRDWLYGPDSFEIGAYWGKCLEAQEGEIIYRHRFVLRWRLHLSLDRC